MYDNELQNIFITITMMIIILVESDDYQKTK